MSPHHAIARALRRYGRWHGRARRSEFWWLHLFRIVSLLVATGLDAAIFGAPWVLDPTIDVSAAADRAYWITAAVTLVLLLPTIAVEVRRLHDIDRSGGWWWLNIVPLGTAVLLLFFYTRASREPNRFAVGLE